MPPEAMASRVWVTTWRAPSPAPEAWARRISSRLSVWGNLGAAPKPPHDESHALASCCRAVVRCSMPGTSAAGFSSAKRFNDVVSWSAWLSRSSRLVRQASSTASSSRRKLTFGK